MPQEIIAPQLKISVRQYGDFEREEVQRHDPEFLEQVAIVLKMTPAERVMLFLYTIRAEPTEPEDTPRADEWLDPAWGPLLRSASLPGYVSNAAWDIELHNRAFQQTWLAEDVPGNTVRFILLDRRVRHRYFPNWAQGWALPLIRQLRAALLLFPWEVSLERLHREVVEATKTDSELDAAWQMSEDSEYVYPHPSETRLLNSVKWGDETEIKLLMTRPLDPASGRRLVWLVPTDPEVLAELGLLEEDFAGWGLPPRSIRLPSFGPSRY